jgi:GT2 family glycosyltransferase
MTDLSIIIITWKMKSMLSELLHSIVKYTEGISYEIIIVDNYSGDGTVEMIRSDFPDVILIENSENRGVARARNQALPLAKGRYVLILDADMLLKENSLKQMIEFMDRTPDAGICSSKLIFADNVVQLNARRYPTPLAFIFRRLEKYSWIKNSKTLKYHEMAEWNRDDIRDVDYVIGACQLIRRNALNDVGLLDEKIFYGPEDIDFCLRMYRNGWKVYYYPSTSIIHYEQRITKKKYLSKLSFRHLCGIIYLFLKYRGKLSRNS